MNSGRRKDELSENINKKTELKKRKIRLKNTVTEILEYPREILTADFTIEKNGSAIWKTR